MKRILLTLAIAATPIFAFAGASVGVTVSVGTPGYYGPIAIGTLPPPPVIYAQPVMVQPVPVGVAVAPIYVRVPYVQYSNWPRYCGWYNACGRPVYFVNDHWYHSTYVPYYHRNYNVNYHNNYYYHDYHHNQHYNHNKPYYR